MLRVLLVQLPIPPAGAQPVRGNTPLAAAYLALSARRAGLDAIADMRILPVAEANRLGDAGLVDRICAEAPEILGFTCYLWNIDRTLWVAEQVRRRRPGTFVILGGPEITPDNDWVLRHPALDLAVLGEGEQTFCEWLRARADGRPCDGIRGLAWRDGDRIVRSAPRSPMPDLDGISSPYLAGLLSTGPDEPFLLETVRGCTFRCKFCYYPKAYEGIYFVSHAKILANLAHARAQGARDCYLLDPTLNQRRDFDAFLDTLAAGNPDGALRLHGELRAEGVTPGRAQAMRRANFVEVEIGLQSIDPVAQERMDRHNNLRAFEKGVRALQDAGVRAKIDLIVGLPGDTPDSIRRGVEYLAGSRLYDEIQVFQLSILPGTAFRQEAAALGLVFQPHPPYYVLRTPTLELDTMIDLMGEAEDAFGVEFDALPEPAAFAGGDADASEVLRVDLDADSAPQLPVRPALAFTLWLRGGDLYARLPRACRLVREHVARNPFSVLQLVLETGAAFPLDVLDRLRASAARTERHYLERFYAFMPGRPPVATRMVLCLPQRERAQIDPAWVAAAEEHAEVLWR